ncbi:MAG: aldo/keto reductase [Caldilineaceae bacterium]|nr:aldo/keto reductase [Caldilineaceae bacterium]
MNYVNFGQAGVKVSPLALGLGLRGQDDEAAAQQLIEHAIAQGINLIDCANVYGPMDDRANIGRSEVVLGRAIKGKRDDLIITSKAASPIGKGPNDRGGSRVHLLREIERSLQRLNTDYVDVYIVHVPDLTTPLAETVRALDDIVRQGKARYIGFSNHSAWQVCHALWIADRIHATPLTCVQNSYSLLNRKLEDEMFPMARTLGVGIMAYSPLAVGLLSGVYRPGQPAPADSLWATQRKERYDQAMRGSVGDVVKTVIDLAAQLGKTPAQLAIAWVLSHPEISVAISGADTVEQFDDVLGGVGWTLEADVRQRLDDISAPPPMTLE